MTITIDSKLEARLRERAEAEGLTVPAYLERLVQADQSTEDEPRIVSDRRTAVRRSYPGRARILGRKHRRLDEHLKKTGPR